MSIDYDKNQICPICRTQKLKVDFSAVDYMSGKVFPISRCLACGSGVTDIDLSDNLADFYGHLYYGNRKSISDNIINYFRVKKVLDLVDHNRPRYLLDVGCGNGSFILRLRRVGWGAFGTEVAPPEHLKNGVDKFISKGDLLEIGLIQNSYDFITMWHSLEHFINPERYVTGAYRLLKDGGVILIEVPNFLSWQAVIFKSNWFHLDVPRHISHFSSRGLSYMLSGAGFKDVRVANGSFIYQFFGYLQSILNVFSLRKNMLFDFVNGKIDLGTILRKHGRDFIVGVIFLFPGLIASLVFSVMEAIFDRNGIMLMSARK